MSSSLARLHPTGRTELSTVAPIDEFRPLDKYSGGFADEAPRVPWLATISAGYLVMTDQAGKPLQQPYPAASRKKDDEWIHMTPEDMDRAPGLYAAVEAGNFRWLDVAVASDDPHMFLQQHFEKRTAGRLQVHGDENQLTEIVAEKQGNAWVLRERRVHMAGSREYADLMRQPGMNVAVSFFFTLAKWEGREPRQYFPASDGLGVYRLRFTSRNSLRELLASLRQVSDLTRGRLAGLPLRLFPDFRQVADPTGTTREIVVWKLRFMPPQGLELTPRLWQELAQAALAEGDLLRVPLPALETVDDAAQYTDVDLDRPQLAAPSAPALEQLEVGPLCDASFYQHAWFARVKGSDLDNDEARAGFIEGASGGRTDSLVEFLAGATEEQAAALIAEAGKYVGSRETVRMARRYDEIFGEDDRPSSTPNPPSGVESQRRGGAHPALPRRPAPPTAAEKASPRDTASGEVLDRTSAADVPTAAAHDAPAAPSTAGASPPTADQNRARLTLLLAEAKKRGITADPPLFEPGRDPVTEAIAYWERRIADVDLDKRLASEQDKGVMF